MAELDIKIDDKRLQRKLNRLIKAGSSREMFSTIGRVVLNRIRLCFRLGIDPWATPWAALKIRKGQPLRDTGRLQRSIVSKPDDKGVTVGTNLIQARTHQFGNTITPKNGKFLVFPGANGRLIFAKRVTIPARPFMPLRREGGPVTLPPDWSVAVTTALRRYFRLAAEKESV